MLFLFGLCATNLLTDLPTQYGTQAQIPEIGILGSDSQYYLLNRTVL
jgi:hypothetical protein